MTTFRSTGSGVHGWLTTLVARTLVLALTAALFGAGPGAGASPAGGISLAAVVTDMVVNSTADTSDANLADTACDDGTGACTIRAAVEQANAIGGAMTIAVPAGTYLIATKIDVTGDITLHGAGIASTILSPATSSTPQLFQLATGASFAAHNMTFDTPAGSDPAVIEVVGTDASVHVADTEFLGGDWAGIFVDDTGHRAVVEVLRSRFADVEYPIFLLAGEQVFEMRDSLIERGGYSGLFVDTDGGHFSVIDSQIVDTPDGGSGIEFWINDGAAAVRFDIIRSQISRNTNQGVRLGVPWNHTEPVQTFVSDSVVEDSGNIGMWLEGDLTITDSIFRNNPDMGLDHADGSLTVAGSTFTGNGSYGLSAYRGPSATIVNTTISNNDTLSDNGYQLFVDDYDVAEVTNVTATGPGFGLGMYATSYSISNTVVHGGLMACDQPYASAGHNADTDGTCGFDQPGDLAGIDPLLGPLADNGGPTPTHEPGVGSPLIDAGSATDCPALDQRGATRPADGNGDGTAVCDIGAVEAGADFGAGDIAVSWEADAARRGLLRPDGDLAITVTGTVGATSVTADVDVLSWYPAGDTTATLLDAPAATTVAVPLTATGAGTHTGQLPLEGIAAVTAIGVTAQTTAGTVTASTTERLPADVAGGLDIDVAMDAPAWTLPNARLWVRSDTSIDGDTLAMTNPGTVSTRWLRPAGDYTLQPVDDQNRPVLPLAGPFEVRAGLRATVEVTGTPNLWLPFSVRLVDPNGEPLADAKVTVTDVQSGDQIAKETTGADGTITALATGPNVTVAVDPLQLPFTGLEHDVTLTSMDQVIELAPGSALPMVTVTGIVEHPHRPPVAGARVSFTTKMPDGRVFTTATRAGEDGRYAVSVFEGDVTVRVDEPRAGEAEVTVTVTGDTVVDLMLDGPAIGTLEIELLTRMAGQTTSTSLPIDGTTGTHFHLYVLDHRGSLIAQPRSDRVDVPVRVGEPLRVCADGREGQLPAACVDVLVDPDTLVANATLELIQAGAVEGTLNWTTPNWFEGERYNPIVEARILRVEDGKRTFVRTERPVPGSEATPATQQHADFALGLFTSGTYEIRFSVEHMVFGSDGAKYEGTDHARIQVEVADGNVLSLGDVPLTQGGFFADSPLSTTSISPLAVVPGDTVRLRVSAHNDQAVAQDQARLLLELPADSVLLPDSVTLDGEPTAFTETSGTLEVVVGTIPAGHVAVLQAWVTVPTDTTAEALWAQGSIVHGADETLDLLGAGVAALHQLTMEFDRRSAKLDIPVWGRAEPNSTIEVSVDGLTTATTTATAGGAWSTTLSLPESPLPRYYGLQAFGELGGQPVSTGHRHVSYDPTYPQLRRAVVSQPSGRIIEIDPSHGVAYFPYVYVPQAVLVDLEFDHPQMVEGPTVSIGPPTSEGSSYNADATYDPDTQLWRATLRPGWSQLGEIRAGWNLKPNPIDLHPDPIPPPLTTEEARSALRPPLSTFTGLNVQNDVAPPPDAPDGTTVNTVSLELPDLQATMDLEITTEPATYTPTEHDLAIAAAAGAEVYGVETTTTFDANVATVTTRAFVPDAEQPGETSTVSADGTLQVRTASAAAVGQLVGRLVTVVKNIRFAPELIAADEFVEFVASFAVTFTDTLSSVADALANDDNWAALDKLQTLNDNCEPGLYELYKHELHIHAVALMGSTTINAAGALLGLVTMPTGVGFGIGLVTLGLDKWMSADIKHTLKDLHDRMVESCPEPDPTDSDEIGPADDNDRPIADPTWVHDPSGYVYDLFEDRPLQGVTATLQHAPTSAGPWEIWDAEWYLQDNPLLTDEQGYYGWDVPEGWWRVRWDADGYATAYSDALEVLPPRFNVNVALQSLSPPVIDGVSAAAGDSHVDVTFETFVDTAGVEVLLGLVDGGGTPVEVTVTPVDPRSTDGAAEAETVATTFRLDLGRPLVAAEPLSVVGDRLLSSYAGVPAGSELVSAVEVNPAPPTVPAISVGDQSVTEGNAGSATVQPTVTLSESTTVTVTVDWETVDGTATAGSDYVAASGTLVFPPGTTSRTAALTVIGDTLVEGNQQFRVQLSNPQQATIGDGSGTVTIIDDDLPTDPTDDPIDDPTDAPTDGAPTGGLVTRSAGADRILTAVQVSRDHWPDGRTPSAVGSGALATSAVLARADLYSDALAGGPFAAELDAPLLLTHSTALPDVVTGELERLGVTTVWLLGGVHSISSEVEATLEALGYRTERIAGPDRFATAAALAAKVGPADGQVVLALGSHPVADRAWPDALSAGALSASPDRLPVLLTDATSLPDATVTALTVLDPTTVWVLGGTAAIPESIEQQLDDLGFATRRLAGATRYETSVEVATEALTRHGDGPVPVVFATGGNFPDGLAATALAAQLGGIVVLVPASDLAAAATCLAFLTDHAETLASGVVVGGEASVSETMRLALEEAMQPTGG